MKKCFFTIALILLSCIISFAHVGLADWQCMTPGENEINNFIDEPTLHLINGKSIPGLTQWYFYNELDIFPQSI
jgi:hypothetical protein